MKWLAAALLFICMAPATAGWIGRVSPEHLVSPGSASIVYSSHQADGAPTFSGALDDLARRGHVQRLEGVALHALVRDPSFQKELMAAVKQSAPKELAEAMRSAGNMHNPKMVQLREPFEKAVLLTPTVKKIDLDLARHGLLVVSAATEKLTLVGSDGQKRFMCFLSLQVSHRSAKPVRSSKQKASGASP
jgi:hypothetical protein